VPGKLDRVTLGGKGARATDSLTVATGTPWGTGTLPGTQWVVSSNE
jgi:hypothetical protein